MATSSRHGYGQSLGKLQNGLSIDLSNLNTLEIDTSSETVTVGPGVKIGDLMGPILEAGYQMRMFLDGAIESRREPKTSTNPYPPLQRSDHVRKLA